MGSGSVPGSAASTTSVSGVSSSAPVPFAKAGSRQLHTKISAKHNASTRLASGSFFAVCFARFLRIFHALLWDRVDRVRGRVHSRCLATKKSRIRTPPVTAVLNAAELSSGFLAFPSEECQHKRLQALRPRLTPGLPKFSVLRDVPGCWYYPTQSGMQKVSFGGGALIFPPGHPALALALFYQIWPCPRKCPNGHKNGICACFYPKSAISCRDCPTNPPKSLCTPPTKSYKFVSANPCKTDAGRINKYDYSGCVGGSFWNFIRFRDSRKWCETSPSSSLRSMPLSPFGTCVPPPPAGGVFPSRGGFGIPSRFPANANQFHRKRNLFAKGSPTRGAGERMRD